MFKCSIKDSVFNEEKVLISTFSEYCVPRNFADIFNHNIYTYLKRFNFSLGRSGVASDRSISHYSAHSSGWNGRGPAPDRTTPPPTQQPPESPYDLWYYKVSHCGNIYTLDIYFHTNKG